MSSIITLTTDFGASSPYVGVLKGVLCSIHPGAQLVDITHTVPPQDVRFGALVLAETTPYFPPSTIHVAVVDPGVGTDRKILYVELGGQRYVLPDNGLVSVLANSNPPDKIIALTNPKYWRSKVSATFHGRDIMAPVAAHLSLGTVPDELGEPQTEFVRLVWPEVKRMPGRIEGTVQAVDSFGNLVTDITAELLDGAPRDERMQIVCDEHQTQGIWTTYADQPEWTFLALIGSSGKLELAIVGENAHKMLGIAVGTPVVLTWE